MSIPTKAERITWTVTDADDRISDSTDVLLVRRSDETYWRSVHVWRSTKPKLSFACTSCAGPRVAMLANCVHCREAKKAHLKNTIRPKEKHE